MEPYAEASIDSSTLAALTCAARVLWRKGALGGAEELQRRYAEELSELLGPDDSKVGIAFHNLVEILLRNGRGAEGIGAAERALENLRSGLPVGAPRTLRFLASATNLRAECLRAAAAPMRPKPASARRWRSWSPEKLRP